jgi:hypothetical protein
MTSRWFELALFEAIVLFQLLLPRPRRARFAATVSSSDSRRRVGRIFHAALAVEALAGGLAILVVSDEWLHAWLFVLFVIAMVLTCAVSVFLDGQRRVASLEGPATVGTVALDLSEERIPAIAWLAAVPPIGTLALIVWLAAQWGHIPLRGAERITSSAWRDRAFLSLVQMLCISLGWSVWSALYGMAMWHGVSRRYAFRPQFSWTVAFSWSQALLWPAGFVPLWLRLPLSGLLACVAAAAIGAGLLLAVVLRGRRASAATDIPPTSYRLYFDWNDPSFFGERGTNLASPWSWALVAAPVIFLLPLAF